MMEGRVQKVESIEESLKGQRCSLNPMIKCVGLFHANSNTLFWSD